MAIDPVCKMQVEEEGAQIRSEHGGKTYYFCAPGCKAAFEEDPEKYLKGGGEGHHEAMEKPREGKKPWWKFW
jgi:YHS domain-containing protein